MPRRQTHGELVSARAACERCNFTVEGNNAQGLAAQHHDAKGHRIVVDLMTRVTYGANFGKTAKDTKQGSML